MIIMGVKFVQCPIGDLKQARGVSAGASCCLRCVTRRHKASFGHNSGSPVAPWTIPPPHDIFLSAECEYHKGGGGELIICGGGGIEYRAADTEGYI